MRFLLALVTAHSAVLCTLLSPGSFKVLAEELWKILVLFSSILVPLLPALLTLLEFTSIAELMHAQFSAIFQSGLLVYVTSCVGIVSFC